MLVEISEENHKKMVGILHFALDISDISDKLVGVNYDIE